MAILPKVKLKALVSFPASVLDGVGTDVEKVNGAFKINLAFDDFGPPVGGVADPSHQNALLWNDVTGAYVLVPVTLLGTGGAVPEAPNDGVQYGRQSLNWTPILSSVVPSNAAPIMDGVAAPGAATTYSRGDHVHPSDTSRAALVHTHTAAQVTDFSEAVDDRVGTLLVAGTNIVLDYQDVAGTLTITSTAGGGGGGSGDVIGPAGAVADRIAIFNGTTGKVIKDGGKTIAEILASGGGSILVSETPPGGAAVGTLWWESDSGSLFIRYDDGNSAQWVQAAASVAVGAVGIASGIVNTPAGNISATNIQDAINELDAEKVSKLAAGDTMAGNLTISKVAPTIALHAPTSGNATLGLRSTVGANNDIYGYRWVASASRERWLIRPGNAAPESGSNAGSDFNIISFNDAGAVLETPLTINRATGIVALLKSPTAPTPAAGDNTTKLATTAFVKANTAPFDAMAFNGMQINGGMEVSQETAYGTRTTDGYVADGWYYAGAGPSVTQATSTLVVPPGFIYGILINVTTPSASVTTGRVSLRQGIEGYRTVLLAWGTATALPITLGFWSKHTLVGTYSVGVRNGPTSTRSYVTTYTQAVSDVWQYNTITVPGDQTGTWNKDNAVGIYLDFVMAASASQTAPSANTWTAGSYTAAPGQVNGVATAANSMRITGVVVLPGTHALTAAQSPLLMRPYGDELELCKRYYQLSYTAGASQVSVHMPPRFGADTYRVQTIAFSPTLRGSPTMSMLVSVDGGGAVAAFPEIADSRVCSLAYGTGLSATSSVKLVSWVADARL